MTASSYHGTVVAVGRACGHTRTAGSAYVEFGLGEGGAPVEDFLLCPDGPINPQAYGISAVGVKPIVKNGVTHIIDWVGATHYPNVADFIEEVRRMGLSRKIAVKVLDDIAANYPPLSRESRILLVHGKAWLGGAKDYFAARGESDWWCPKKIGDHEHPTPKMCGSLWYEDLINGEVVPDQPDPRLVTVKLPSFTHIGLRKPDNAHPDHLPAFFASFPVGRLAVVEDPDGHRHNHTVQVARRATKTGVAITKQ